jgi:enediyne biosynthesis protein E3
MLAGRIRTTALAIHPRETEFATRGFHAVSPEARLTLEAHGASFVRGFNTALEHGRAERLAAPLAAEPDSERGFAYEGAAMALTLLDLLTPGRGRRLGELLGTHGAPHVYMVHVGAGWALARLHLAARHRLAALDPFLRWLTVDGYGFHHGFFGPGRYLAAGDVPLRLRGYELRAFDQGLGRSLWFFACADVERAGRVIDSLAPHRRADVWSGLALAAAYTTAASRDDLGELLRRAGRARADVAQGAAFGAVARLESRTVVPHTHVAAEVLCQRALDELGDVVVAARAGLSGDPAGRGYEAWRARLRERLAPRPVAVA